MRPLVSILMTTFNKRKYFSLAVESILASSFTDFELIIVDDGSTDDVVALARSYASADARIHVYENEKNLGDYPNRNRAASYAKGKYLKFIDADDYIYPHGLEIMVKAMEKYPEAGWGICGLKQDRDKPFPFTLKPEEIFEYQNFRSPLFHKSPLFSIIKKEVFDAVGGFSGKRQMSDVEMWHILSLKYSMVLMPEDLVWYRMHDEQESIQIRSDVVVRVRYAVAKYHFYQSNNGIPMPANKKKLVEQKLFRALKRSVIIHLVKMKLRTAYVILKMITDPTYDFKAIGKG